MEYALIRNGKVENVIVADQAFITSITNQWQHIERIDTNEEQLLGVSIGWGWDGTQFIAPTPEPVPEVPAVAYDKMTKLGFRNRFTAAEKVAIEIACLDNPSAPMAQRQQAAALRASQADVAAATFIDPQRQDTRDGVIALEAAGILAAGRALEILDEPITEAEAFKG